MNIAGINTPNARTLELRSGVGASGFELPRVPSRPAREAAEQLVATALINPLLAQMRNDPFRSEFFHGGFAEDAFGSQLDTILADRVTRGSNLPIVDALERYLTRPTYQGASPVTVTMDRYG